MRCFALLDARSQIAALGRCALCFDGFVKNPQGNASVGAMCVDAAACGTSAYGAGGICHECPAGQVKAQLRKPR